MQYQSVGESSTILTLLDHIARVSALSSKHNQAVGAASYQSHRGSQGRDSVGGPLAPYKSHMFGDQRH